MLSQHCAGGAREVMVAFYAESALRGRCAGGAQEIDGENIPISM